MNLYLSVCFTVYISCFFSLLFLPQFTNRVITAKGEIIDTLIVPYVQGEFNLNSPPSNYERNDALKVTFNEAKQNTQNVTILMMYELKNKVLEGEFYIPDYTNDLANDNIHFIFDIRHHEYDNQINGHDIAFYRNGKVSYFATNNSNAYNLFGSSSTGSLMLKDPFIKVDYIIQPSAQEWYGKFKIFFKAEPQEYGFMVQQQDNFGSQTAHYANFPPQSNISRPSSWINIKFGDEKEPIVHHVPFVPSTKNLSNVTIPDTGPNAKNDLLNLILQEPVIDGLKVTINGGATSQSGSIIRINFNWGDGISGDGDFLLSHRYSKAGLYNIVVKAFDSTGTSIQQSTQVDTKDLSQPGLGLEVWAALITAIAGLIGGIVAFVKLFVRKGTRSE